MNFVAELPRQAFAGFDLQSVPVRVTLVAGIFVSAFLINKVNLAVARSLCRKIGGNPTDFQYELSEAQKSARRAVVLASRVVTFGTLLFGICAVSYVVFGHKMV